MRFLFVLCSVVLGGCAISSASKEADIQRMLASGDYQRAIVEIERGPLSSEWSFSLGLLYAYREIEVRGEKADFTKAILTIRAAAPQKEEARQLLADYEQRGVHVFFAFPWAHMIGPFPERHRPRPEKEPNQPPEPTRTSAGLRIKPESRVAHL